MTLVGIIAADLTGEAGAISVLSEPSAITSQSQCDARVIVLAAAADGPTREFSIIAALRSGTDHEH